MEEKDLPTQAEEANHDSELLVGQISLASLFCPFGLAYYQRQGDSLYISLFCVAPDIPGQDSHCTVQKRGVRIGIEEILLFKNCFCDMVCSPSMFALDALCHRQPVGQCYAPHGIESQFLIPIRGTGAKQLTLVV